MIIRKTVESITKRTYLPSWPLVLCYDSCIVYMSRPFIVQHIKLKMTISLVLSCQIFLIFGNIFSHLSGTKAKQKMAEQPKLLRRPLPPKLPSKLSTPREKVGKGKLYKNSSCSA